MNRAEHTGERYHGTYAAPGHRTVPCPVCPEEIRLGLPRSTTVLAVTDKPDSTLDDRIAGDPRSKRRPITCSNDNLVHVYFEF